MKKLETLRKEVATINNETLTNIINNNNVDVETLTEREKLAVLVFAEMSKALTNTKQTLLLDCNFANSKFHNKTDESENIYLVDYFCLVSNDDINTRLMQFYFTATKENVYFRICTSCKKATREQFTALAETLKFKVNYDKKTNRAKTSERKQIAYDEICKVVKDVLAVLSNDTKKADK